MYCNKNYQQKFDEKLKEQFFNTYKFWKHDNNNFILLLQKKWLPSWIYGWFWKIQWNIITTKRGFLKSLKYANITNADYTHVERDFEIKNLKEYHDLYVQSDTLLLADIWGL